MLCEFPSVSYTIVQLDRTRQLLPDNGKEFQERRGEDIKVRPPPATVASGLWSVQRVCFFFIPRGLKFVGM